MFKFKKPLSFILAISLIILSNTMVFAVGFQEKSTNRANSDAIKQYKDYGITIPKSYSLIQQDITITSLISELPVINAVTENEINITTYDKDYLYDYIVNCKEILSVDMIEKTLYIDYETLQNERVILTYSSDGLATKSIYDYNEDKAVFITDKSVSIEEHFLADTIHEISEEQSELIDKAIDSNNIEELYKIDGLFIEKFEDTLIIDFEPKITSYRSSTNFNEPSSQFVPYTKKITSTQYKYSSALKKNVKVSIKESMNTYKKTKVDLKSFGVGTGVTAIAYYLGGPAIAAVKVLTVMGVLNSAKDAIVQGISLTKSASYDYTGAREGYAYDTTIHNKDVKVYINSSKGILHGGNNSNGVFTWINYQPSSAFSKSISTIVDKTIYNYNADLVLHGGYCTMYAPD